MSDGAVRARRALVITVSDGCSAGTREDTSGPRVAAVLREAGLLGCEVTVVPDEAAQISAAIREAAKEGYALVATTGGTGLTARDVTPEATLAVCDRLVPGIAEMIRADGLKHTKYAVLSRGVCGMVGGMLVINLPGSPAGAESSMRAVVGVLGHALDLMAGKTEH